jgi:hypothetical protein
MAGYPFLTEGWTSAPVLTLAFFGHQEDPSYSKNAIIRWTLATVYWIAICQRIYSHSLLDVVLAATGSCTLDHNSIYSCIKGGGTWNGLDISGHCFLLIHATLYLTEEVNYLNRVTVQSHSSATSSKSVIMASKYALYALIGLWWFMLTVTGLYFHNLVENALGSLIGLGFWYCFYVKLGPAWVPSLLKPSTKASTE